MKKQTMGLILGVLWLLSGGEALAAGRRGEAPTSAAGRRGEAPAAAAQAPAASGAGVVNLNDATQEQLELLPGIGPSRAKALVDHRKTHPFRRVEELTRIKGIGKKTFARLKPLVALSGPTTLTERPSRR